MLPMQGRPYRPYRTWWNRDLDTGLQRLQKQAGLFLEPIISLAHDHASLLWPAPSLAGHCHQPMIRIYCDQAAAKTGTLQGGVVMSALVSKSRRESTSITIAPVLEQM
jgi:hypothetical protein